MKNKLTNGYQFPKVLLILISISFMQISYGQTIDYDIVIINGRVMDPETQLDAIRNVGISADRIVEISGKPLKGQRTIDASGLVVAPGFIDLHVHGQTNAAHVYQARDGVTTALELEGGIPFLDQWIDSKRGKTIVNFGATTAHGQLRAMAMKKYEGPVAELHQAVEEKGWGTPKMNKISAALNEAVYESLSQSEIDKTVSLLDQGLAQGALGIGVPVGYYPGATGKEMLAVYQLAADRKAPIFTHTRGFGLPGINEAIANATVTGAPLHIVHLNSLSLGEIDVSLAMVAAAQKRGLDITTELYPYTAASTSLQSVLFDEGWQESLGITYEDLQWEASGERLTEESFQKYRQQGGVVIIHMMKPEWIEAGIRAPFTMIGSDGMPYAAKAHPRTAGTFSRVLGLYVREKGIISLMDALAKMTVMPAKRLEVISPAMRAKGRIQVGADADITIFDAQTIIDKADFTGLQFSEGVQYVLVNGTLVVDKGASVEGVFPGRPVLGKYKK